MQAQNIRLALRFWRREPKQFLVTVATLATGLTCVVLVLTLLNGFQLRPLPFRAPDELALAGTFSDEWGSDYLDPASFNQMLDIRRQLDGVADVSGFKRTGVVLSDDSLAEHEYGAEVSANLFGLLGVSPLLGRSFDANDEKPGATPVAAISERLWRDRYHADPNIAGRVVRLNAKPVTIVAVMRDEFSFPTKESIWLPASPTDDARYALLIRRNAGATDAAIRAALQTWFEHARHERPDDFKGKHIAIGDVRNINWAGLLRQPLYMMLASTILLLILACTSAANLLGVRVWAQRKDMIVRVAVGATRRRIVGQVLTESLLLGLVASVVAVFLTTVTMRALIAWFLAHDFGPAHWQHFDVDFRVLALTGAAVFVSTLLAGLPAALSASRSAVGRGLQATAHTAIERPSRGLGILAMVQVGLSCTLLVSVGMMVRAIFIIDTANVGISANDLLTTRITLPSESYATDAALKAFFGRVRDRLSTAPGVDNVSIAAAAPGTFWNQRVSVATPDKTSESAHIPSARAGIVDQNFFNTYGISLQEGRPFDDRDASDKPPVAIVDRNFVDQFSPDQPIVGRQFKVDEHAADAKKTVTVIGIVGPVRLTTRLQPQPPSIFFAAAQNPLPSTLNVTVHLDPNRRTTGAELDRLVADLDRDVSASFIQYETVLLDQTTTAHLFAHMFYIVGVVAMVLATSGLYGVMMVSVSRRTREIGLRRALGSPAWHILRLVFGKLFGLAFAGVLLGLLFGIALARSIDHSLLQFGGSASPLVMGGTLIVLLCAIVGGATAPALRALRADPAHALRSE